MLLIQILCNYFRYMLALNQIKTRKSRQASAIKTAFLKTSKNLIETTDNNSEEALEYHD